MVFSRKSSFLTKKMSFSICFDENFQVYALMSRNFAFGTFRAAHEYKVYNAYSARYSVWLLLRFRCDHVPIRIPMMMMLFHLKCTWTN